MNSSISKSVSIQVRIIVLLSVILIAYNILFSLLPTEFLNLLYVPANLAFTGIVYLGARRLLRLSNSNIGFRSDTLKTGASRGLLVGLAIVLLISAGIYFLGLIDRLSLSYEANPANITDLLFRILVRIPLGTAITEEVLFRGILIALLISYGFGNVKCIIISSIVFGLWHLGLALKVAPSIQLFSSTWLTTAMSTVGMGLIGGVVFGIMRFWTKSLVAPILVHWLINSTAVILVYLS